MCLSILTFTIVLKFSQGALADPAGDHRSHRRVPAVKSTTAEVARQLSLLDADLDNLVGLEENGGEPDPSKPTAVLLVAKYGGLGVHSMLSIQRTYPGYFSNLVFVSVAVHDSGHVQGRGRGRRATPPGRGALKKYVALAKRLGLELQLPHG